MRRLWGIATALALVFPFLAHGQSSSYYDRSYTRMSHVQGDVYVQRAQNQGFEQGEVNLVLVGGDKIGTRAGRLEVQLGRGNYLRLDNDTQLDLVGLPGRDGDPTKIHVLSGSIFLRVQRLDREKNFEIHTPDASFYVLNEGLYRIDVRENRETEFSACSGTAEAAGEEGSVVVRERQRISAANGKIVSEPLSMAARNDDFGAWNEGRDGTHARSVSQSYLPADYADYESELSDYGSWSYEPEYGNVWVPRVAYSDWRPYSYGRWVWYPIIGWTWISSDPWGWCTYHYGRWGWRMGLGWYWIPQRHWAWGPAWVNWWYDDDYIGWCPLSYWDYPAVIFNNIFYGRYRHGEFGDYRHFARTMVTVDRRQLQNRRIDRAVLGSDRLAGRIGRISLNGAQPGIRPALGRHDGISTQASSVLSRTNVRTVDRSFSGGRRLSTDDLRSSIGRRANAGQGAAGSRILRDGAAESSRTQEIIRGRSADPTSSGARRIREFSSGGRASESGTLSSRSSGSVSRTDGSSGRSSSTFREYRSRNTGGSTGSAGTASGSSRSTLRRDDSSRSSGSLIREYGSRDSGSRISGGTSRSYSSPSRSSGSSSRSYSAPSRSYSPPSRSSERYSYSAPSRNSGSSRSYSAPSRSYSAPSRSYSAPSRSYSSPSRSYSTPSRSYSAPSRSYSSPSRSYSYSAPSRSYSAPSRSYSAPSRSYGSSRSSGSYSRSSGSSSRSSGSSYSRSSSSSSGRSSSGSSRRR